VEQPGDVLPQEIVVSQDRLSMHIAWQDGRRANLSSHRLRSACRCAWCTRDRIMDRFKTEGASVSLVGVEMLGSHGLHIKFSDGHERGIFPWLYLGEIAEGLEISFVPRRVLSAVPSLQSVF
jgi:DUF971 family protein